MQTIDYAHRLSDTHSAVWYLALALLAVAATVAAILVRLAVARRLRVVSGALVIAVGFLASAGIVHASYDAWYRHRCVHHSSDIPECHE
ncbi:MAG TPA: hypothetical protein VFS16_10960 [Acidimicrobiia bacterium]|nr:hypothetical protein [Acidimicrobiia bacterium]